MTVEERLYKLEGIVEGVMAVLPDRVSALEARMDLLRQEVKAEIAGLRQEMEERFNGLRQEVWAEISGLRQEMDGLRQEVRAEINTAFNKAILYFTGIAVVLGILTLLR
jgi:phosphoglycerate-specific signal transduction histidine kinase